ncbi:MAG: sigma-54-dependent Fis family transcriptional regulator [Burkholderiales bacterium]|nr:sigma-54-dependent Fis family transcriptional regulator [Burkholderiales bacterium]
MARAATDPSAAHRPRETALVVDDEPGMCSFIVKALQPQFALALAAGSAEEALALAQRQRFDLFIVDITLPGMSGLELLRRLREQGHPGEVVLISAYADLEVAIEALRAGAGDLLLKPFRVAQLLGAVTRALERSRLRRANWLLERALRERTPAAAGLVGRSIVVKGLQAAIERVAAVDSTVLLSGESGTGKELAALALHRLSTHAAGPFVPVHCAAVSPAQIEAELFGSPGHDGLFVCAQGGTLFLDGIAELPLPLQATLLRALETRRIRSPGSEQEVEVDARIVAASNRPLRDEVDAGRFRADLYWRLQVVEIHLPPLESHKEDIPDLVAHFIATLAPQLGVPTIEVSDDEMRYLQQYDWPGNVRELRNLIERSLIVGALNVSALYQGLSRRRAERPRAPPEAAAPTDLHALEKRHILAVLESVAGDKSRAAQLLGISRRTLERRWAEWSPT